MIIARINFDGACDNSRLRRLGEHPSMGLGIAVFINGKYSEELSKFVHIPAEEGNTSNVAEWLACLAALKLAAELKDNGVTFEIQSDSQVIVNQFSGEYSIKSADFRYYRHLALRFAGIAGIHKIKWVRRDFNKEADRLSKLGRNDSKSVSDDNKKTSKAA